MNPKSFIRNLEARLNQFQGNVYVPGNGMPAEPTSEGPMAVSAAIAALENQPDLPPLNWNDGLYLAAQDHCLDAGTNNLTSWMGSDKSNPGTRLARYGVAGVSQGQNLAFGSANNGLDIIMQLIIDDGARSRPSRSVIFNPAYKLTGIATCAHKSRTMMASILYTDTYAINQMGKTRITKILPQNPTPLYQEVRAGKEMSPIVRGTQNELDQQIYYWQNKLRTDPSTLLPHLQSLEGKIQLTESNAIQNAIRTLTAISDKKLPAFEWNEGLNLASKDHCEDLGQKGLIGHFGTDESSPFDRISRYGKPGWWRGENLWYRGPAGAENIEELAKNTVLGLFIDDATAGRPNRHRMLNPEFKMVGIYSCPHGDQGKSMTVMEYSGAMSLNNNAQQGIMAAQEENAAIADGRTPVQLSQHCSALPTSIVTPTDCAVFKQSNQCRTNPTSCIAILNARKKEIEDDSSINVSASQYTTLRRDEKTYENLIKTERAIAALLRASKRESVPALQWSDALFLNSRNHCIQQKNERTPTRFTDLLDAQGKAYGKQRPRTAVQEIADAQDVELNIAVGDKVMDIVIDGIIKPENRSILMNPANKYSSVSVCSNDYDMNVAIQNFASAIEINPEGKRQIANFMKAGDIFDECTTDANRATDEKQRLQVHLTQLMTEQSMTSDRRRLSNLDIKMQATLVAIRLIDESFETIQQDASKRQKAKADLKECESNLAYLNATIVKAQDEAIIFAKEKEAMSQSLQKLLGTSLSTEALTRALTNAQNKVNTANEKTQRIQREYAQATLTCENLKSFAYCIKPETDKADSTFTEATTDYPAVDTEEAVEAVNEVRPVETTSDPLDEYSVLPDLEADELDDLFCNENCGTNLMAGRKLSVPDTSDAATIVFGSADLAI